MKPDYWDRAKRALARRDPVMALIMRSHPKVFLAPRGDPFFTLARAIVGQQKRIRRACFNGRKVSVRTMTRMGEAWRPWRSVATWYLWRSLDPLPVEY